MQTLAKIFGAGIAALALAAAPAHAAEGRNAALLGGLAAGALVGGVVGNALGQQNAQPQPEYVEPRPVVRRARPVYEQPVEEEVVSDCHFERRKSFDVDGNMVGYRRVKVCD